MTIDWQEISLKAQAIGPILSAIAILAAIAAAVIPPRMAGAIEQRRWRTTALRLAKLLHEAIDEFGAHHGLPSHRSDHDRSTARDTLMLRSLVERCEGWPADSIGDPDALEAFIRLAGVGRTMLVLSAKLETRLSREQSKEIALDLERLCALAHLQFQTFEVCQKRRMRF